MQTPDSFDSLGPPQLSPRPPHQTPSSHQNGVRHTSARTNQRNRNSASCTLCRRRKVKCDRSVPCGSCVRAGVDCVPSIRSQAPRGRQGGRKRKTDGELLERIAKLEALIENVGESYDGQETAPRPLNNNPGTISQLLNDNRGMTPQLLNDNFGTTPWPLDNTSTGGVTEGSSQAAVSASDGRLKTSSSGAAGRRSQSTGLGLDRYMGTSFWVTLSEEINGIKDVLTNPSDGEDEAEDGQTPASSISSPGQQVAQPNDSWFVIPPAPSVETHGNPTPHQLYIFCGIYLLNVDPVFKILHAPSLRRYLQEGAAKLDCSPGPRGLEALKFSISYAATLSMTDEDCRHRIGEAREVLMARYRAGTEQALAKADFVNTVEMSTLQAMTIYLASVRVNDTRRLMWTLTSLAVRIAQAMGLHHECVSSSLRPFEREMRRRLWWQICVLDSHAAEDRATNPMIYADSFNTKLPLHINDADLHVDSSDEIEERQSFTDMTFCLNCQEIMDTIRQLNYRPVKEFGQPQIESRERWTQRINAVINLQRRIEERYLRHLNLAHPFHWGTRLVADIITAMMWLVVYRPLQQRPYSSSSQVADPGILGLSVDVLERAHKLNTDPAASSFRWLSQTYVQWHALAVTIAELCVKTEGPVVERAWAILIPVFQDTSQHIADSEEGMLWRPIKKLMNKAQRLRQQYLDSGSARANLPVRMSHLNASGQGSDQADAGGLIAGATENVQGAMDGVTMEGLESTASFSGSAPFDWDPWLAAASTSMASSMQNQHDDDVNQMAWTNWEDFVSGFQGQDEAVISVPDHETSEPSSFWP